VGEEQFEFQRARRPEQVDRRREAILTAAAAALDAQPFREVTLAAIAKRAGLVASGVLRYFDSREAIFSEVLGTDIDDWLEDLHHELGAPQPDLPRHEAATRFAAACARTAAARPRLCELLSVSGSILEHNVTVDSAKAFKQRNLRQLQDLADLLRAHVPDVPAGAAMQFATAAPALVTGTWPHARPSEAVAKAIDELAYPSVATGYTRYLATSLANQLVGAIVLAGSGPSLASLNGIT